MKVKVVADPQRASTVFPTEILKAMKPLKDYVDDDTRRYDIYHNLAVYVSPPYTDDRFINLHQARLDQRLGLTHAMDGSVPLKWGSGCHGLLEHWAEEFRRHISLEVFADDTNEGGSHGVAYIGGVGDISTARFPLNHKQVGMASAFHLMGRDVAVVPFSRNKEQYHSRELVRGEDSDTQSSLLQLRWFRIVVDEANSTAMVDLFHLSS
eukprot:scaffold5537_cov147-Alexandrium_tamarense.AAC.1